VIKINREKNGFGFLVNESKVAKTFRHEFWAKQALKFLSFFWGKLFDMRFFLAKPFL
jgi:hypothetical protein